MSLFTKHYRYINGDVEITLSPLAFTERVRDALGPLENGIYDLTRADTAFDGVTVIQVLSYENMLFNGEATAYRPEYARLTDAPHPNPWQHVFGIIRKDERRELTPEDYIGLHSGINKLIAPFDTQHANTEGKTQRRIAERVWDVLDDVIKDISVRIPRAIDLRPEHFSFRKQKNAQTRPWRSVFYKNKKVGVYYIEDDVAPDATSKEVSFIFGGSSERVYVTVPDTTDETVALMLALCLTEMPTPEWANAYDVLVREMSRR